MRHTFAGRAWRTACFALVALALATPALAQLGSQGAFKGRVVDQSGKPVPDADLSFDIVGEYTLNKQGKTDAKGEFVYSGFAAVGRWTITATKGDLSGRATGLEVAVRSVTTAPDIVLRRGTLTSVDPKVAEAEKRRMAEVAGILQAAQTSYAAGNYDEAIARLTDAASKVERCGQCYLRLGDAYLMKRDRDNAEKAYLRAAEFSPQSPEPLEALAGIYNEQQKFAQAGQMTEKAAALRGAAGAAAGGAGDATAEFNAGVIMWNQSKISEAIVHFERAVKLNPNLAEAQYRLGMALVSEGKAERFPDALRALETYLKIAPNGPNAQTAKDTAAVLPSIIKK